MKLIELRIENFMRIKLATIRPDGKPVVVLTGKNGAGKSCALRAIMRAYCGKRFQPPEPIRRGATHAEIAVTTDEFVLTLRIREASEELEIVGLDGSPYHSPQKILDKLRTDLSFDPRAFLTMSPKSQVELCQRLAGVDFAALNARREKVYTERTMVGRELKQADGQLAGIPPVSAPDTEVRVSVLSDELAKAHATRASNDRSRRDAMARENAILQGKRRIEDLTAQLSSLQQAHEAMMCENERLIADTPVLIDPDTSAIEAQMRTAEETNRKVRQKHERAGVETRVTALTDKQRELSELIAEIDAEKEFMITGANLGVPGLTFDESGVQLNNLPFEQASCAERLRASVGMGMALNPDLRLLTIEDASVFDSASMELLNQMAEEHDFNILVERATDGQRGVGIVFEDGLIVDESPKGIEHGDDEHLDRPTDGRSAAHRGLGGVARRNKKD